MTQEYQGINKNINGGHRPTLEEKADIRAPGPTKNNRERAITYDIIHEMFSKEI